MKKLSIMSMFFVLCSIQLMATRIIYRDDDQCWELVDVNLTEQYTIISCNILILSSKAGCVYANDKSSKSYLQTTDAKIPLAYCQFRGTHKPWARTATQYEWQYYKKKCKNDVIYATFYFPRIPAGIEHFNWNVVGGYGAYHSPADNYSCPNFKVKDIEIDNKVLANLHTLWTEQKLKTYWTKHAAKPMEGIYTFVSTTNNKFWGDDHHTIAILYDNNLYNIIYLNGASQTIWQEGDLKGELSPTYTRGLYKVSKWYLNNKMPSKSDFYLTHDKNYITLIDNKTGVKTMFLKLYPANDLDIDDNSDTSIISSDTINIKGNGTGFFVSGNIIATNYHVVDNSNKIVVCINDNISVKEYKAKVLCADKTNDLALLQIDDKSFLPITSLPYSILPQTLDVGSSIYAMGYPMSNIMGQEIKVTDGIISSKTGYDGNIVTYQISAPLQPGNSGGPLFNRNGEVVGITSSGIQEAENVGYAIKSSYLINLIESAPINIDIIGENHELSSNLIEQIKAISPFVVLIYIY